MPAHRFSRRQFIGTGLAALVAARSLAARMGESRVSIRSEGIFIRECQMPGETRADGVFPAHPNGIRLSKDRTLLLYATRGWRGVDEDRSIIYQVRLGGFTGPVLKEGLLAKARDDWDPLGDGSRYFQAHGHPGGFGVPKGAMIDGRPAENANLFVIKWYSYARYFSAPDRLALPSSDPVSVRLGEKTVRVQWVHVRLNETENDIEILDPVRELRASGFAVDDPAAQRINQTYVQPVPFNRAATEWIDMFSIAASDNPHRDASGPVAAKFTFNRSRHRYELTRISDRIFPVGLHVIEGGALKVDDGWAMFARPTGEHGLPLVWVQMADPFSGAPARILAEPRSGQPIVRGPVTGYRCADGRIRIFTGDSDSSPSGNRRDPLYCWEADPANNFALTHRQTVLDVLAGNMGFRPESEPIVDMAKVLPHCGGSSQWLVFRVRTESINYSRVRLNLPEADPRRNSPAVNESERHGHGIYLARIDYGRELPDAWDFA